MSKVHKLLSNKGSTVWSLSPENTVFEALLMMEEKGVGALAVVHNDELVGMISERDYARKIALQGKKSKETKVKEIMTSHVYYTYPEQDIEDCLVIMTERRFRHLPVMSQNKMIGMISVGDVVKEIINNQQYKIKQLENYIAWEESY